MGGKKGGFTALSLLPTAVNQSFVGAKNNTAFRVCVTEADGAGRRKKKGRTEFFWTLWNQGRDNYTAETSVRRETQETEDRWLKRRLQKPRELGFNEESRKRGRRPLPLAFYWKSTNIHFLWGHFSYFLLIHFPEINHNPHLGLIYCFSFFFYQNENILEKNDIFNKT